MIIPDSVISIGRSAFASNSLTSLTIGNSVTSIGEFAFSSNALTSVTIGNSVTSIGNYAFGNNAFTSVIIPDSVTSIGDFAFFNTSLTSVTIPDSVTSIGKYAFAFTDITSVTIQMDDSDLAIADDAFPEGVTIIREATVDAGTYNLNDNTNEVSTFTLDGTGTLAFANLGNTPMLTVTEDAFLDGGNLTFGELPTAAGTYTLIDVVDGGTLSIDTDFLNQAISDVDAFDGNRYDYTLLQQDNDLILEVVVGPRVIEGTNGSEQLVGSNDAEILMGYGGSDYLLGGNGNDVLNGGRGADFLLGGNGDDTLTGGAGRDTFMLASDRGIDVITDFTEQDSIFILGSALGGIIVNPVFNSSTGELSVTRQTIEMQTTYYRSFGISIPVTLPTLVSEEITLAVLENPTGFDVSTDVRIG